MIDPKVKVGQQVTIIYSDDPEAWQPVGEVRRIDMGLEGRTPPSFEVVWRSATGLGQYSEWFWADTLRGCSDIRPAPRLRVRL